MDQNMYIPFTYHIAWTKHNLHYYGVKFAKGCHPNDLWNPYKTSSNGVKSLLESIGEPDIIEVRKEFSTMESARDWEVRVLKRLGVTKRDDWINEACWPVVDNRGRKKTDKTKKKMSEASKGQIPWIQGKKHSEKTKNKIAESHCGLHYGEKNHFYGKKHSEETKNKMSNSLKEIWRKRKCYKNTDKLVDI